MIKFHKWPKWIESASVILTIGFPFYLWLGGWHRPVALALYLAAIGGLRAAAMLFARRPSVVDGLLALMPIALGGLIFTLGPGAGLYYPTAVNLMLLLIFYSSLSTPTNFIQGLAEKIEQQPLDSIGIKYTAYVTKIWCLVFLFNASISALLASRQMIDPWTLYNGFIAYLIMAVLLGGERLLRPMIKKKMRGSDAIGG